MANTVEQERAAIEADEKKLSDRRRKLVEREQSERQRAIGKSVLMKLDQDRLETMLARMKDLGVDEVEKRLQQAS
ncbi:hypothetical protein [Croceicoccus marinus]|uniref:Mobilization protein n=1 Tax=Croceicoccus marinus TaxID=450378 RepID=A0A7G6W142_9SPHN|nr:hypothetical protein [Croceicoccus marinus]QNE07707.1 hypothetical protein H4O24_19985 [Croceicoccus marinus]